MNIDMDNVKPGSIADIINKNLTQKTAGRAAWDTFNFITTVYFIYYAAIILFVGVMMWIFVAMIISSGEKNIIYEKQQQDFLIDRDNHDRCKGKYASPTCVKSDPNLCTGRYVNTDCRTIYQKDEDWRKQHG